MDRIAVRLAIWLIVGVIVSFLAAQFSEEGVEAPRRPLPPDTAHAWMVLPPAEPPDGTPSGTAMAEVEVEPSHWTDDVIGTAFAVGPHLWVSAGHVFEACTKSYVRARGKWLPVTAVAFHPTADLAVVRTGTEIQPPIIGVTDRAPVLDQDGYHFGYPQGAPGSIHTRFLGEARIRRGKPGTPVERGWVWAEMTRTFDQGSIAGISGGPQVDRTGAVQGVTILEWPRASRIVTAPVDRMRELLPKDFVATDTGGTSIDGFNYDRHGDQVRGTDAVAFVLCSLTGRTRLRGL